MQCLLSDSAGITDLLEIASQLGPEFASHSEASRGSATPRAESAAGQETIRGRTMSLMAGKSYATRRIQEPHCEDLSI